MTPSDRHDQENPGPRIPTDEEVEVVVARGPTGAFAVAGIATAIVVALYVGFYVFVYLPRGAVQ
jgi:hypothetical protein